MLEVIAPFIHARAEEGRDRHYVQSRLGQRRRGDRQIIEIGLDEVWSGFVGKIACREPRMTSSHQEDIELPLP